MPSLRIGIAGATGYAGEELIRILHRHPAVTLTVLAASAKRDRPVPLPEVFPRFSGLSGLSIESLDPGRLSRECDLVFLALPHGMSMDVVPALLAAGRRVIDLGGDFRFRDPAVFERWYRRSHSHPELLAEAVYGLTELNRAAIARARLIANPGCYATSVILALAPLLKAGLIEPGWIAVDAKSGLTGAGRKADPQLSFASMNENLWPYKVGEHQHAPEIIQALSPFATDGGVEVCVVPHVVPINRGILSTVFARLRGACDRGRIEAAYRDAYAGEPFVRALPAGRWPEVHDVAWTNDCVLAFTLHPGTGSVVVSAAIDNLTKGAAGQAVQNLNVMCGWDETTGLS
ncbi:MAG TPA: N-acetyl-gamma-glutamyl-phosphate reductase [bacterium]